MICCGHRHRLDHWVTRWFRLYGECVGRHPAPFILAPLISAVLMSVGIIFIRITKDVTPLFLSNNVPSLLETRVFMEFTAYTAARYYLDVLIVKNNRGPLLSEFYGRQHVQIANDLLHNVTVFRRGETYTLADLCQLATCWSGMEFINDFHQSFNNPDTKVSPNLKFDFPVAEAFGTKIPLWSILGNVTTDRRHSVQQAHLLRVVTSVTIKSGANHVSSLELYEILRSFGLQFEQHFHQQKYSDLELYTYYNDAIEPATTELSLAIIPKLTISLVLLGLFTVVSCMSRSYRSSKGLESIAGILNTFMAYGSAVGLISIFGGRDCSWNSSLCVTPFLVLAIGVDDMFVLISSWNRTNPTHSVPKRMGDLMADGSVSILITSLTNVISFAVGISQSTPAVKAFSIYTSVALSLEFFYQMTFFMGVMAYGGYREKDQMKRFPLQLCHKKYKVSRVSAEKLYDTNSSEEGVKKKFPRHPCKRLLLKLLSWRIGRITIVALFTGLLVVSVYGCTCIQVNFAPRKLVLSDSNFERYYDLADKTVFKDSLVAYVTVNRPPNISDPEELRNFYEFVKAIEQIPHAVGAQSTELWLNDYLIYLAKMPPRQDSLSHLLGWLEFRENSRWKDVIVYRNNSDGRQMELVSFQFVTLYSDLGQFYQKNRWLSVLRDTYLQYSQFNVSVYTDFSYYADQVLTLPDNVMQDAAMATIVISLISFLMVPNASSMFWVIYIVLVIEAGVISCLKLIFDADLDPITMITITMSVGFSVEYNLHVSHFFYTSNGVDHRAKTAQSIEAIGWPVVQSSISTLLGVSGLILVPAYIPRIFFSTIITVVILGLLHSMLLLPVLLTIFST